MQASKKFYNKFSKNSSSQVVFRTDIFRKLTLGAPVSYPRLNWNVFKSMPLQNAPLLKPFSKVCVFVSVFGCHVCNQSLARLIFVMWTFLNGKTEGFSLRYIIADNKTTSAVLKFCLNGIRNHYRGHEHIALCTDQNPYKV